jgi:hypothetical protein
MNDTVVHKYLAVHAEQEVGLLADFPLNRQFHHCLVIPAYNETAEFFTRLQLGPLHKQNALCILVINQPTSDADTRINDLLMQQICLSGEVLWHHQHLQLLHYGDNNGGSNNAWLIVDRFHSWDESEGQETVDRRLPDSEAVGLARKIGCDIAAALVARSQILSGWIHSTDADVFLPRNYFDLVKPHGYSAAVYDFKHQNDGSAVGRATALYEQALNYYVKGLAWAGSPYAYHTLGSTLAINAETYCHVRGFPRRSGGEDFYLLNKLAKLGKIYHPTDCTLRIKARESSRVPFGTGPAVAEIMHLANPDTDYTYYNPQTFVCLREWLAQIPQVWTDLMADRDPLEQLSHGTAEAVQAADWPSIVRHLKKQARSAADAERALHNWFDAFQTLKFIHYLQKHYYPALPLKTCLAQADFIGE